MNAPGYNENEVVDGKSLYDHYQYYSVNVLRLGTLSHEDFCKAWPNAAEKIRKANEALDKLEALLQSV